MSDYTRPFSSFLLLVLGLTLALPVEGQMQAVDEQAIASRMLPSYPFVRDEDGRFSVPQLYEGEWEDLGPQYMLLATEPHDWFYLFIDLQAFRTSNVNLAPNNKRPSDITVLTMQGAVTAPAFELFGGQVYPEAGFRFQYFRYGMFGDRNKLANGIPVKDNDFRVYTPYAELNWQRGQWFAGLGLSYNHFESIRPVSRNFYEDIMPYWEAGYYLPLSEVDSLMFVYDGNVRISSTFSNNLAPSGINNRTDHGLTIYYTRVVFDRFIVQPNYRLQYSHYTSSSQNRDDLYNSFTLIVSCMITDNLSARLFTSYDQRNSSVPEFFNYDNWNFGGGVSLDFAF